jgi:hypothetical protein
MKVGLKAMVMAMPMTVHLDYVRMERDAYYNVLSVRAMPDNPAIKVRVNKDGCLLVIALKPLCLVWGTDVYNVKESGVVIKKQVAYPNVYLGSSEARWSERLSRA